MGYILFSVGICEETGVIMSAFLLKFLRRLYTLFKFYSAMALLGALAVIVVGIVLEKPVVLIAALMIVCIATMMVLLLAQSYRRPLRSDGLPGERPPILPESLMIVSLPSELADDIIGDLRQEFDHLGSKYGRYSAITWYTIQSWSIFIKAVAFHCGLSFGKSLTSESRR
jgi:hypothetical protein